MRVMPGAVTRYGRGIARYRWKIVRCKWRVIRYALDDAARTRRLCLIILTMSVTPLLITVLARSYFG